jgi:hypothetical protein
MRQERPNMTVAHSAPVFVIVDGQPFWKTEAVGAIAAEQKARLVELMTVRVDPRGDLEPWETLPIMPQEWERQQAMLADRVKEATTRYDQLAARAAASRSAPRGQLVMVVLLASVLLAARHWPA